MPTATTTVLDTHLLGARAVDAHTLDSVAEPEAGALDVTVPLLVVTTQTATCVCGHGQDAHEHYRRGNDCALCDCPRYRRRR